MQRVIDRLLRMGPEHPIAVLIVMTLLCGLALSSIVDLRSGRPRLVLDPSVDSLLPTDDERRLYYERTKLLFDSGEMVLVALVAEDVFTPDVLERGQRITERLQDLAEVNQVTSLSTAMNIRSEDGNLVVEPFLEEVPEDEAELEDLRRRALSDPIYAGSLVSLDSRVMVVVVQLLDLPERELIESGVDARIAAIVEEERGDSEAWITGDAHVKSELTRLMLRDLTFVVPVAVLFMCLVALLSFRTLRGVMIPLLTVGISVVWTVGWLATTYGTLNQVTVAAPPILLVVGFAYAIHILSAYYDVLRAGEVDENEAVLAALREVSVPVFFTGVTTAAGFFSLMTSPLGAIREFGAFCGIGVCVTVVVSLTFAPALLQLLPAPGRVREKKESKTFDDLLESLARFDLRNRRAILGAWTVLAVMAFLGMFRIVVSTDMVSSFQSDNPVRQHFDLINDALQGASEFQIVFEGGIQEAFKDPENLRALESVQQWLVEQPEVGGVTSIVDYVKAIHQGLQDGSRESFRIPDSRDAVSQLLVIGGNDELARFVDSDYAVAKMTVRSRALDSAKVMNLVKRTEARLAGTPSNLQWQVTGNSVLLSRTMDEIALGQALSLGTAFGIIYLILALLFTSFRMGFIALIPNAMPVLAYFGILGWTGVTLNTTTGLVACLVLGIAVDDTIHLMAHFNAAAKKHADITRGVVESLNRVGRPVTYTTVALCLGFTCLMLSDSNAQKDFGWLAACTLAVAWVVDMTLTPAIAGRLRVVTLWDVITLDLGRDPHLSIPLFAGLSPAQARIAALLGTLREYPKEHRLIRQGEAGDQLYVVIDGELASSVRTKQGNVLLRQHRRGDVIGEVALFKGHRTADVQATSDVRLLSLTQADFARLKRRYPRIGAQLYLNLSKVLADRLSSLTERVADG